MINRLTVTNYLGDSWTLDLRRYWEWGIAITGITGIDAVEGEIFDQEMASSDGSIFTSSRAKKRNIVISASLLPVPTVEQVRHLLYKMFPVKRKVNLRFETEERTCEIDGYVETNSAKIFEQSVPTQISIICPYPYFYSTDENGNNVTYFSGIEPLFEFPFSNESLTEDLIEFGSIENRKENVILYEGDENVGVIFYINAVGTAKNITIYNTNTRSVLRLDTEKLETMTGSGVIYGDEIIVSTVKNDKYVRLLRNGEYTNIINILDRNSDWIELSYGENIIAFDAEEGAESLQFRVENRVLYEGV